MQGNNPNPNNVNNGNLPGNIPDPKKMPEYRLVIDEKPYRRRSVVPILVMVLLFVGIIFGIKAVIGAIFGSNKTFDPETVEVRKFEDILNDRNVSFYIGDKIYTTRLANDAEIVEIGSTVGYSIIRDSLYYKYSFKTKDGISFDDTSYSIDNSLKTVNYLNKKDELVVSIRYLDQTEMDSEYMKKMCLDFINNTKKSSSSVPISEYLKRSIIYGYKANLSYITKVNYEKDVDSGKKIFKFSNSEMTLSLSISNKELDELDKKEFDDGYTIYFNEEKYYIVLGDNTFEIGISLNDEKKEVDADVVHNYFVKSLSKN